MVQINAFKSKRNAQKFVQALQKKGYPAFMQLGKYGRWHKVRIGPFPTWKDARKEARRINRNEGHSAIVLVAYSVLPPVFEEPEIINNPQSTDSPPAIESVDSTPAVESSESVLISDSQSDPSAGNIQSDSIDKVMARFLEWKTAWVEGDLSSYLSLYSSRFDPGKKNLSAWKRSREKAFKSNTQVSVGISEIELIDKDKKIEMSFIQKYDSRQISDVGYKTLVWVLEDGVWKIVRELWSPV